MIGIQIAAESLFKIPFLGVRRKHTFIIGEKYKLSVKIKNMDSIVFPGGEFQVRIAWSSEVVVIWNFPVESLAPNEIVRVDYGITHVLGPFVALIMIQGKDSNWLKIDFCDMMGNPMNRQESGFVHVGTILPRNADELYQLWALAVTVVSLFLLVMVDVIIPLLKHLFYLGN